MRPEQASCCHNGLVNQASGLTSPARTCALVGSHVFNSSEDGPAGCVYCGAASGSAAVPIVDVEAARALARARWQHLAAPISAIVTSMLGAEQQGRAARAAYAQRQGAPPG